EEGTGPSLLSPCVGDGVQLAILYVQLLHLIDLERARAATSEDGKLVTALVDRAIAIEPLRKRDRLALGLERRDQLWRGLRTEAPKILAAIGRDQLQHAQSVPPVGDVCKRARVGHADANSIGVVDRAAGVEYFKLPRLLGILHVENREALLACRDIRVR